MSTIAWFTGAEQSALRDYWAVYESHRDELEARSAQIALEHPEFGGFFRDLPRGAFAAAAAQRRVAFLAGLAGDWSALEASTRAQGAMLAHRGVRFAVCYDVLAAGARCVLPYLVQRFGAEPERLTAVLEIAQRFGARVLATIGEEFIAKHDADARASETRKAALLDAALDAVVGMDHEGRITEFNRAAEALFGYTRDEALGRTVADTLVPVAQRARHREGLARCVATGDGAVLGRRVELTALRRDGTEFPIELAIERVGTDSPPSFTSSVRDLSERASDLVARRRAESRFARLSDARILGIIVTHVDGRVLEINDALLELVGYAREPIVSGAIPWRDLTPPEYSGHDTLALEQLAADGVAGLREKVYVRSDGRRVPVMVGSARIDDAPGELISFVLDLTAIRQAEAAIELLHTQHASDAMFRSLLEAAPDAIIVVGRDGRIVLANRQTERLFGYTAAELVQQPIETLVPARFRDGHVGHRTGYLGDPHTRPMGAGLALFARRKDGSEFPCEISLAPLETDEGTVVTAAVRDTTERYRAEELRARLAAIVESSDDAIIGKTLDGVVVSWNRGAQRVFGYAADEIVGTSITRLIPVDRRDEERELLAHVAHGEVTRCETVRIRSDGRAIDVEVTVSPVRDARGAVIGASKVARDISQRKRAESALVQAKSDVEIANRELEAFSYSVAHDLRAPLRGMNGFAQILLDTYRDKLDAEGRDCLEEILQNARRMGALIDALLSLARVTRSTMRPQRVDLSALARAIVARLAAQDPERVVAVELADDLVAGADPELASVLLENLLGNAWKFTGRTAAARIEFGRSDVDGVPAFFVRDNGAGFDPAHAQNLFASFRRLHTVTEFPGTGIGLATVQRIAHRHGGRVWAEGQVGAGATFHFTLPAAPSEAPT